MNKNIGLLFSIKDSQLTMESENGNHIIFYNKERPIPKHDDGDFAYLLNNILFEYKEEEKLIEEI